MAASRTTQCPGCEALQAEIAQLRAEMQSLRDELTATRSELAKTKDELAKATKNSDNSSKPPSSDLTKPKKKASRTSRKGSQRKRGAQPGHKRHQREPFDASEIDHFWNYTFPACPDCGGAVEPSDEKPRAIQQVELLTTPVEVSEHRGQPCWCPHCRKTHYAPVDADVRRAGLVGPRLSALVAYLKGACHCSFSTIRKFLRDVVGVKICRGQLRKVCAKVSDSLESAWEELLRLLPHEERLNVDETGHKDDGNRLWTWCFRAGLFSLFKIDPSRSSQVLVEVLGEEFAGVLGCDYFSAYRKYMRLNENVLVQFCLAHLIRDIKFLVAHPEPRNRKYGRRVLKAAQELFAVIHRREDLDAETFALQLEDAAGELCGAARFYVPKTAEAENLADRFREHGESYVRFLSDPEIEPTNNLAEQAIRFVVIDRRVTQGSRSEAGQRWLERIWTAIATCTQQGRSVFEFLHESVIAHFQNTHPPSLAPAPG